jgi:sugar phosphate isomerase/epimerase
MHTELTLSRRTFLGASAGAAATVAFGRWSPSALASERLVPPGKLGIQLFTVRDQIPRLHNSVVDMNPANPFFGQPLPGGFRGVFEALASFGYKTVEFAGYTQGANGPITTQEIRALLDEFGLTAVGTHLSLNTLRTNLAFEIERCQILGMGYIGTANRPTDGTNAPDSIGGVHSVAGYEAAAAEFNAWGETCAAAGLKLYQHNHTDEFRFATDQPSVRVYDVWIGETDPRFVHLEMDIYWAYAAKNLFPGFEPLDYVQAQPHRYALWHVKDGAAAADPDGLVFVDVGDGIIDFRTFFDEQGNKGYHQYIVERDSAPGGSANPGQSYRTAQRSAAYLLGLRA